MSDLARLYRASAHYLPMVETGSVQSVITSPPYFGLRKYDGEQDIEWPTVTYAPIAGMAAITVQGCEADCEHEWADGKVRTLGGGASAKNTLWANSGKGVQPTHKYSDTKAEKVTQGAYCQKCGGWRGPLGNEPTIEAYIAHLILCAREWRRCLHDTGVCFVNLGDSYSSGVGANLANCFNPIEKGSSLFFRNGAAVCMAAYGVDVPLDDQRFPYGVLLSLLGIERITVKQRDNDFCQVISLLALPRYAWIGVPLSEMTRHAAHLEIVVDAGYDLSIIISNLDFDSKAVLGVPVSSMAVKNGDRTLAIEKAAKPIAEIIADGQTIGDSVTFNAPLKRLPNIYLVDDAIPFSDGLVGDSELLSNLHVSKATEQQFTLTSKQHRVNIASTIVGHDCLLSHRDSVTPYAQLYQQAISLANGRRVKQEMGVPERFKLAMQADGWICRSTMVWAKPNPMPESVTDRPTKAHEMIYLFSKQERYFWDAAAVAQPTARPGEIQPLGGQKGTNKVTPPGDPNYRNGHEQMGRLVTTGETRNMRTVLTIATQPYSQAHFAVWPVALVEPMIKAGSRAGDTVLDPFSGSGTTGRVAVALGRRYIGIDLAAEYLDTLAPERLTVQMEMPT